MCRHRISRRPARVANRSDSFVGCQPLAGVNGLPIARHETNEAPQGISTADARRCTQMKPRSTHGHSSRSVHLRASAVEFACLLDLARGIIGHCEGLHPDSFVGF
jgi:hypothetical protein